MLVLPHTSILEKTNQYARLYPNSNISFSKSTQIQVASDPIMTILKAPVMKRSDAASPMATTSPNNGGSNTVTSNLAAIILAAVVAILVLAIGTYCFAKYRRSRAIRAASWK
jgi:hypothetical protein